MSIYVDLISSYSNHRRTYIVDDKYATQGEMISMFKLTFLVNMHLIDMNLHRHVYVQAMYAIYIFFRASSIVLLHLVAFLRKFQMPRYPTVIQNTHTIVKTQPTFIALIQGAATIAPTQLRMFRTKLLMATPAELFLRINSVSIVVAAD